MRRSKIIIAIIMALILCMPIAGCSSSDEPSGGDLFERIKEKEGKTEDESLTTPTPDAEEPTSTPEPTPTPTPTPSPTPTVDPAHEALAGTYKYVADMFVGDGEFNFTDTAGELKLYPDGTGNFNIGGAQWVIASWTPEGETIKLDIDGQEIIADAKGGIISFELHMNVRYFANETADLSVLGNPDKKADIDEALVGEYIFLGSSEDVADPEFSQTLMAMVYLTGYGSINLTLKEDGTGVFDYGGEAMYPTWHSQFIDFGTGEIPIVIDGSMISFTLNETEMVFRKLGEKDSLEYKWSEMSSGLIDSMDGKYVKVKDAGIKIYVPSDYKERKPTEKEAANGVVKKFVMDAEEVGKNILRIKNMPEHTESLDKFYEDSMNEADSDQVFKIRINGEDFVYIKDKDDKKISFTAKNKSGGMSEVVFASIEDPEMIAALHFIAASIEFID